MKDLTSLGLLVRSTNQGRPNTEQRFDVRITSTGDYVAGFYAGTRASGDDEVRGGMSTDFVYRKELSEEQIQGIKEWLREQILANMPKFTKLISPAKGPVFRRAFSILDLTFCTHTTPQAKMW